MAFRNWAKPLKLSSPFIKVLSKYLKPSKVPIRLNILKFYTGVRSKR